MLKKCLSEIDTVISLNLKEKKKKERINLGRKYKFLVFFSLSLSNYQSRLPKI